MRERSRVPVRDSFVTFRLAFDDHQALRRLSSELDVSVSSLVRFAMTGVINNAHARKLLFDMEPRNRYDSEGKVR